MNFLSVSLSFGSKSRTTCIDVLEKNGVAILRLIREHFFLDYYDSVLSIRLARPLSDHSLVFQVDCHEQDELGLSSKEFPSQRAAFFVMNFSPDFRQADVMKFHEVESWRHTMWETIEENYQNMVEELCEEDELFEVIDQAPIGFEKYFISFDLVIDPKRKLAVFGVKHTVTFYHLEKEKIVDVSNSDPLSNFFLKMEDCCGYQYYRTDGEPIVFVEDPELA